MAARSSVTRGTVANSTGCLTASSIKLPDAPSAASVRTRARQVAAETRATHSACAGSQTMTAGPAFSKK